MKTASEGDDSDSEILVLLVVLNREIKQHQWHDRDSEVTNLVNNDHYSRQAMGACGCWWSTTWWTGRAETTFVAPTWPRSRTPTSSQHKNYDH